MNRRCTSLALTLACVAVLGPSEQAAAQTVDASLRVGAFFYGGFAGRFDFDVEGAEIDEPEDPVPLDLTFGVGAFLGVELGKYVHLGPELAFFSFRGAGAPTRVKVVSAGAALTAHYPFQNSANRTVDPSLALGTSFVAWLPRSDSGGSAIFGFSVSIRLGLTVWLGDFGLSGSGGVQMLRFFETDGAFKFRARFNEGSFRLGPSFRF